MRQVSAALLMCLGFTTAHASSVVLDFEETPYISTSAPAETVISQGYRFSSILATAENSNDPILGNRSLAFCAGCTLTMEHVDGLRFSLAALDLQDIGSWPTEGLLITGYRAGGGTISQRITRTSSLVQVSLGAEWLGLTRVDIGPSDDRLFAIAVDNIGVTAVPVPPAIWLMGSALGALALRRRRAQV